MSSLLPHPDDYPKANFGGNLQATDYMIKPVQRICKYPLLMREVARNLPEGHRVQVQVIMSLSGIEAIAGTVNSAGESSEPVITFNVSERCTLKPDLYADTPH